MQLRKKPRITVSLIFKIAEGPMLLKPRKLADYVCDEVCNDTFVRKEGSRGKKNRGNDLYAIVHCYCESKRLRHTIKS